MIIEKIINSFTAALIILVFGGVIVTSRVPSTSLAEVAEEIVLDLDFGIGYSVDFWNDGGIKNSGVTWIPHLHNSQCRAAADSNWQKIASQVRIDFAIDRMGLPRDYSGLFVIDYEPYIRKANGHWNKGTPEKYLLLAQRVRNRLPDAKIAFFGLPTIWIFETEEGPGRYPTDNELRVILSSVDFIAPQIYSSSSRWEEFRINDTVLKWNFAKRVSQGKPVIPEIGFHIAGGGDMPVDVTVSRINLLRGLGADGVTIWGNGALKADQHWEDTLLAVQNEFENTCDCCCCEN